MGRNFESWFLQKLCCENDISKRCMLGRVKFSVGMSVINHHLLPMNPNNVESNWAIHHNMQ